MSRLRYFENPYRGDEEKFSKTAANVDSKVLKRDLINIINDIQKKEPPKNSCHKDGLYVGSAGIGYALLHVYMQLSQHGDNSVDSYIPLAAEYLRAPLKSAEKSDRPSKCGFLCGHSGTLAVAAVLAQTTGDDATVESLVKRFVDMAEIFLPLDFLPGGSDEFFVGRAGYLYGSLWLNKKLGKTVVPVKTMHDVAQKIVTSGRNYATRHDSPCPLMYSYHGTEYLGAAHGLCAILQVLIQVPDFLAQNQGAEIQVKETVDYLLTLENLTGHYPCALDEIDSSGRSRRDESRQLVHWCHGSPGVIYLMAAAYLHWKENNYLEACERAGELVWRKGLLKKGPGTCHGVAGSGYVFLLLYRLTGNNIHLDRAKCFADFMNTQEFKKHANTPDRPYSLYEGTAGTACFLADLMYPEKAAFPFQDVF